MKRITIIGVLGLALLGGACTHHSEDRVQGYVEGEYVYVASPYAGALFERPAARGQTVEVGAALFSLDPEPERTARDEAERRLIQGRSQLADTTKGRRAPELDSIQQQLQQARAAAILSQKTFARQEELFKTGASARSEFDSAQAARDQDAHRIAQLEADLQTAELGSRDDQIAAAAANVRALEAALGKAEWNVAQKKQAAPRHGLIFDTLYEPGEWVPAGRPVISLLPPENMKVRAFVPETKLGAIHAGDTVQVRVDGAAELFTGRVAFISPEAEYTPPVIYSQESRGKLVFLIELRFDVATSAKLHPGQPVDVIFNSPAR